MKLGEVRVGHGYDVHRLVPGRPLILGGVSFEHALGLEGHSDADVLVHALMDALLGAAGLPDIGHHFPSDDDAWRNASSLDLLVRVHDMLARNEWQIVNVDITLVAEAPRIGSRVDEMKTCISTALGLPTARIGLKATTSEGAGAEGRGEAISAQAVALLGRRG